MPCSHRSRTWLRDRLAVKGDLTLEEIVAEMAAVHGVGVHRGSVGKSLHRLGLSHKKNPARQRTSAARRRRDVKGLD
jgi:transposase